MEAPIRWEPREAEAPVTSFVPLEKRGVVHEADKCFFCVEMAKREARMKFIVTVLIAAGVAGILYGAFYAVGLR